MLTQNRFKIYLLLLLAIILIGSGCSPKSIKIGFSAELTGARGELGVMARDGALLAVSEINAAGGLNGRPIELIIKDDQGDPEIARQVDEELLAEGVVAVIGHITSGQTAAVIDLFNDAEVVLISGSATSSMFSDQDDYFIRIASSTDQTGSSMADYLDSQGVEDITVIYDEKNGAFALPFITALTERIIELGSTVQDSIPFRSGESDLGQLAANLKNDHTYMIVASAVDTAMIMQYTSLAGIESDYYTSSWAGTAKLIEAGGEAVEGLELITAYDPENPWPAFQIFKENYRERYHTDPGLLAPKSYDTVFMLANALENTGGKSQGLREAVLQINEFSGVEGLISLNKYGDAQVNLYIAEVIDGNFIVQETIQ
jgi:branched-chain amino acid transport system substrate-binding protein